MQQSWLLRYSLLIVAATREALTYSHEVNPSVELASSILTQKLPVEEPTLHEVVIHEVIGEKPRSGMLLGRAVELTSVPVERGAPVSQIPMPTAMPLLRQRQDDGQIQALSEQLRSLSQSATDAISSISSSASSVSQSAQSVRQSADQAVQSANQEADQVSRQLSQTQSSASSAVSAVNARASEQISRSLSSMSSQILSVQSSANNAVSSARVAASQFAASKIQAFKADASGTGGSTSSPVEPAQPSSISTSNLAIIVTVSIIGTAVLSTASSCLFLRYRRKRSSRKGEALDGKTKTYEKPIAVRGSPSPRFPRFEGGSRSPTDNFRLPSLSPIVRSKKAQREARNNTAPTTSGYSNQEVGERGRALTSDVDSKPDDAASMKSSVFRLQKDNGVSSATTVRLIRVGSDKGKSPASAGFQQTATEPMPPLPAVATLDRSPKMTPVSALNRPNTQYPSQSNIVAQPPRTTEPPPNERRVSARSTRNSETETPGWRPPIRLTTASQNRFVFRDSSDMESNEPTPTNTSPVSPPNPNRTTLRASSLAGAMSSGQPKNAAGTFATFPRGRTGPPRESMLNRGRPRLSSVATGPRGDDIRRRELSGVGGGRNISTRSSRDIFNDR